jgi:hypothetical protein
MGAHRRRRTTIRAATALSVLLVLVGVAAVPSAGAPAIGAGGTPHACLVPGLGRPLSAVWHPRLGGAIAYARRRAGDIAFAVRTETSFAAYRPNHQLWSASVLKAMLLTAYLDRPSVARRNLTAGERSLLTPMITVSDNAAANTVDEIVGASGLQALAARVGMTRFAAVEPIWGESAITPRDQTKFFLHIDRDIASRHRAFAMHLLSSIVPWQRWGIGEVAPRGWHLYFKGGWGSGTGLIDNQVALLTRGCARVSIAVLTMHDGSHAYGKQTLRALFHALLVGLPTGPHSRYR